MLYVKKKTICASFVLILVLSLSFVIGSYMNSTNQLSTREIDVESIGRLSYEEKTKQLLSDFDVYSYDFNDNTLSFDGEFTKSINYFNEFDFLSTNSDDEITQKYSTRLNLEEEKFILIISYIQNNELIEKIEHETTPIFDSEKNDYFIKLDNGKLLSVSETMDNSNLNNCIALVDDAAILLTAALAITVVAAAPYIVNVVTTVVTQVISWVRSFFWWLRSLFVTNVVTTVVTQVASPSITIANTTYRTESKTEEDMRRLNSKRYYVAFADPTNGKMYLSISNISEAAAVAILNTPIVVPCIGDTNRSMIASTYTFMEANALKIASIVGLNVRTPAGSPEKHGSIGYFWHYHTISSASTLGKGGVEQISNPHSFFGLPV